MVNRVAIFATCLTFACASDPPPPVDSPPPPPSPVAYRVMPTETGTPPPVRGPSEEYRARVRAMNAEADRQVKAIDDARAAEEARRIFFQAAKDEADRQKREAEQHI